MTDPIADLLTRIKNALLVKKTEVVIPFSKIKFAIAKILKKENFIEKVEKIHSHKNKVFEGIKIILKYENDRPVISELKRISKPSCRIYLKSKEIRRVKGGLGILIVSTSRGIMTGEEARKRKLGGEILCEVW